MEHTKTSFLRLPCPLARHAITTFIIRGTLLNGACGRALRGGAAELHKIEKKCLECFEMREYVNLNLYNQSFFLLSKSLSLQWIFKRLIYTFIVIPETKNHHIMYYLREAAKKKFIR